MEEAMTFAARVASVVLVSALLVGARTDAASFGQGVRLEPARMFDRASDSLFAALESSAGFVDAVIFNMDSAAGMIPAPPANAAAQSQVRFVHLAVPLKIVTPPSQLQAPALALADSAAPATEARALASVAATRLEATPADSGDAVSATGMQSAPPVHFGTYEPYIPTLAGAAVASAVPSMDSVHLDADAFRTMSQCGTTDDAAPCTSISNESGSRFSAQTNFSVRAGNEQLRVQLAGSIERITQPQTATFPYMPLDPDPQFSASSAATADPQAPMLTYPGVTNLVKHGAGAALAVPITRQLTLGVGYETQRYQGDYGSLAAPALTARKDAYLGGLSYQLNPSSAITLSGGQYRYQNGLAPDFNLTQTRADLNFTVKF